MKVYEILRRELQSQKPEKLPRNFIAQVTEYVRDLITRLDSPDKICSKLARIEYENFKLMFRELYMVRLRKLSSLPEGDFSKRLLRELPEFIKVLKLLGEEVEELEVPEAGAPRPSLKLVLMRVTSKFGDVIYDDEGFIYGPFEKDDVIYVAEPLAKRLEEEGVAVRLVQGGRKVEGS